MQNNVRMATNIILNIIIGTKYHKGINIKETEYYLKYFK